MSAVAKLANPYRIKAAHRRRGKCSTGHRVYANNNPVRFTDPDGRKVVISGSDEFKEEVQEDIERIEEGSGGEVLIKKLRATKNVITITQDLTGDGNRTQASTAPSLNGGKGTGSTVTYDPSLKTGGVNAEGDTTRPPFVGLTHELGHARAIDLGKQSYDKGTGKDGTTPPSELHSLANENMVRKEHGLPLRPSYYSDGN